MTSPQRSILAIPVNLLKKCPQRTIMDLMEIVNNGYDKQVVKYGIVQTPRIHEVNTFFGDLGLDIDDCIMYIMVDNVNDVMEGLISTGNVDGYEWYDIKETLPFKFSTDNVKSTLAYRPLPQDKYPNSYEITGFTSFGKGCGLKTFEITLSDFKRRFNNCKKLIIKVIVEHELVSYYEKKLGFVELDRVLQKKSELQSSGFEESFMVSRDFHVSSMVRTI
ncbi:similar to Saccharomyces cerevisiae YEL072W RMD6 Protein required for sporulation [Maudiozyma saulgeensis]|uniref:Similar to Saccharomyces cerevisiae YEL072W RMD6 Protein required for sporulation n=1 Tax=Maudiozyma saulgeensis TaxID=1789683 RepID=A0A1X7R7H7_9SACH|nr:similar to Saccharomyces cerevisiae YEL072W RMD6 Protein required for sporulation [Kazachstania saulgeensis]